MRALLPIVLLLFTVSMLRSQSFEFSYDGPDTLFVDESCEVVLNWGHPDQPTVQSAIGANITAFDIFSISGNYELNELVGPGLTIDVTYQATDDEGNEDFFTFTITTFDDIPPQITSDPQNQAYSCDEPGIQNLLQNWYDTQAGLQATDNCQAIVTIDKTWEETLIEFNQSVNDLCGNTRNVDLVFTVTDSQGNSLPEVSATFSTFDDDDPVFVQAPMALDTFCVTDIDLILENWLNNAGGAIAEDNCSDDITWRFQWSDNTNNNGYETVGNTPYNLQINTDLCNYTVNVVFFAEDACGNQEASLTSIQISDNNAPAFDQLPQDTLVNCDAIPTPPELNAFDDCKGALIVLFETTSNQNDDPLQPGYYNYTITETWSASDGCGHEIQHSRDVVVQDTTPPDFEVPADLTVGCSEWLNVTVTGSPQNISDECSTFLNVAFTDRIEGAGCSFTVFRDWTVADLSGNVRMKTQVIQVVDDSAPNISSPPEDQNVSCYGEESPEALFLDWLSTFGNAVYEDDCGDAFAFTALPGTYVLDNPDTYPGTYPGTDFLLDCSAPELQVMFRQTVDFVFYDECDNAIVFTRTFSVVDEQAPQFGQCPPDTVLTVAEDECEALYSFTNPVAFDDCTGNALEWTFKRTFIISSEEPGSTTIPVDTLTLMLGPLNLQVLDLEDILSLNLSFFNLDADDNQEYFVIRGEDDSIIGRTPEIDEECGDFVMELKDLITSQQLEDWAQDDFIELVLEPNIVPEGGIFSINDICGNSYVEFSLVYSTAPISQLQYSYSLNQDTFEPLIRDQQVDIDLPAGNHQLVYRVSDCAGNSTDCIQAITVEDVHAPEITCPGPVQLILPDDSCTLDVALPLDLEFNDNCKQTWQRSAVAPASVVNRYLSFGFDEETELYTAKNKTVVFDIENINFAVDPVLKVYIQGDTDNPDQFFEILDENGQLVGKTPQGSCDSLTEVMIPLDPKDFNNWLMDGMVQFVARAPVDDGAIQPCDPGVISEQQSIDSISQLFMQLDFESIHLAYEITGATEIALTDISGLDFPPVQTFNGGVSNIQYILYDAAMNTDTCSIAVNLVDQEKPVAVCKEAIAIFINPSGIDEYLLKPEEVDDGSFDNCRIDSMAVVPSVFDCSQAGSTVEVLFYVWDAQGNVDSCLVDVKVETMVLQPSFQAGVCAFDTLKLFANLPDAPPGIYTILWTKENNGFSSNEENPVRPNADSSFSGTYTLEVTGLDGCFSNGFTEVFIEDLSTPVIQSNMDTLCLGSSITLETNTYSGNVTYKWFRGIAPNGTLIDSTEVAVLELTPALGLHDYYVIVESRNCVSLPSQKKTILVKETPVAVVDNPFISICEGDDIVLGTDVSGPNFTYQWWGPDSYSSNVPDPQIIQNATIQKQGTYRLAVFNGICSDTALVEVLVNERPATPVITSDSIFCEGETIVMSIGNITNADTYSWYRNGDLFTVENSNTLVIPDAQSIYNGLWQAIAKEGDCYSDTSAVQSISIEEKLEISASNSGPVCEGDSINLFAPEIPGAQYTWVGPDNDTLEIARPRILAKPGLYQLELVTLAGCNLNASTEVEVVLVPEITALSNNAPACIDGTECIEFKPSIYPNLANYEYNWSGPNDFVSTDSIAVLCQADTSFNGTYSLVVSNGLCQSEMATTEVMMYEYPEQPVLSGTGLLCELDTLVLEVDNYVEDGMTYLWSTPNGNVYQTTTPKLILPQAELAYTGYYFMQSFNGNCYSEISDSLFIEVLKKPNQPVIWTANAYCEGDAIKLFTNYVEEAEYFWEGPNGFTSSVQNPVISPSDTLDEGVYRLQISVNGCYSEISEGLVVTIKRKPAVPVINDDLEPLCLVDGNTQFELCLENPLAGVNYTWYHNDSGTEIGQGSSACIQVAGLEGIVDGLNGFYAVGELAGCISDPSELVQMQINLIPDKMADAGPDLEACNDESLFLEALPDLDGYWVAQNDEVALIDALDPNTGVSQLSEGDNSFVWILSHGVCYDYDSDTMIVHIIRTPEALDDIYQTGYDQNIEFEPAENDLFAGESEVIIDPSNLEDGELSDLGGNSFAFDPFPSFVGEVTIPYLLVHNTCRNKFSEGSILIRVSEADDCFGVNVITPNGDGINDILLFPCLDNPLFPKNKLTVFNQWGDEVFTASPYNNDWQGTYRGEDLPVGTYYYLLDLRNGSQPLRDFFVIER